MAKRNDSKKSVESVEVILPNRYRLKCKNHIQKDLSKTITEKEIIIAYGPAGTGKSYVSVARAIELLQNKTSPYSKIIISTPAEEAGENLGFLPGSIREKMEPYLASTIDIFDKIIGKTKRLQLEQAEILQIQPLGYIRGKSIDNSILIMEECQNMSPSQMKTLLTRIGENSKFIISGDLEQSDRYRDYKKSGLFDAINRHSKVEEIGFIEFETKDIVRNPLITKILNNYTIDENNERPTKSRLITSETKIVKNKPNSKIVSWFKKNFKW